MMGPEADRQTKEQTQHRTLQSAVLCVLCESRKARDLSAQQSPVCSINYTSLEDSMTKGFHDRSSEGGDDRGLWGQCQCSHDGDNMSATIGVLIATDMAGFSFLLMAAKKTGEN